MQKSQIKIEEQIPNLTKFDLFKYNILKLFRCKLNKKYQFIEKSERRFQNDFDFAVILKKLMDLGKLKMVILNEKQRRIFNSIQNFDDELLQDSSFLKDIKRKEKNDLDNSLIDQRLCKLYDLCCHNN